MYRIIGRLNGRSEVIDTAGNLESARYMREEYQIAFGNNWIIEVEGV